MSRRVITTRYEAAGGVQEIDTYFDRMIKYIPADIVSGWVAISGLISSAVSIPKERILWIVFAVMVVLTVAWTWMQTKEKGQPTVKKQIAISTIAFAIWVFALGEPFNSLTWYHQVYGSVVLILYNLTVPLFNPE